MNNPSSVACDLCGNVYIAEWVGNRIRKVNAQTGIITTIAGNGIQFITLYQPAGLAVDNSFNVYFSNFNNASNAKIYRINSSGTITSIYNGVRALGLTLDNSGSLYFTDNINKFYKITNPGTTPSSATLIATYGGTNDYTQAVAININLQLFISCTFGGKTFGYYNISGGTYTSSTFNNLYSLINSETTGSIAFNSNNICYVLTTTNNLWISNSSYTSFTKFSLNSSLGLNLNGTTQNPGFDICNNYYIPNTLSNSVIKVTNITT